MEVTQKTPGGAITTIVNNGFIANELLDLDGIVSIGFYPFERPPDEDAEPFFVDI